MASKDLTTTDPIKVLLANNIKAVQSVLPKHLEADKILRMAYTAISKMPKLRECSQVSLLNALIEASVLGLEIGGPLGHAHLLPFGNIASLIIGYQGYMDLAYRSNKISNFQVHPVYAKDKFKYEYGTQPFISHEPTEDDDPGTLKFAYAIACYQGGGIDFEIVNKRIAMVAKNRSKAKNKKDSPWNQSDLEWTMWAKTAIRQLVKRVPLSPEIQRANSIETLAESGKPQLLNHIEPGEIIEIDLNDKINKDLMSKISKASDLEPKVITAEMIGEVLDGEHNDIMVAAMENLSYTNIPSDQAGKDKLWKEYKEGLPID